MEKAMYQSVWITFSDGEKAGFTGKAVTKRDDKRLIVDISFTEPKPLPQGYSLEMIK